MIYLDNNATTRPSEGVIGAMTRALRESWANPMSVHRFGQEARRGIETAREACAALIDAKPRDITFTSGGTEALDLAIRGMLEAARGEKVLVTSRVEHAAVRELAEHLEKRGACAVRWLPTDSEGRITPEASLVRGASLVCVQWVNNETGVIQPVSAIADVCERERVPCVIDATQWVGKERTSVLRDGAFDAVVFAPHKFHGPQGVGCLWAQQGVRLVPQLIGAQELGRRGGTEHAAAIVGAGVAAAEARAWLENAQARRQALERRDEFERDVLRLVPGAAIIAQHAQRIWTTSNIAVKGLEAEAIVIAMSERGVCISAGAACSSGSLEPSPVLLAMGLEPALAHSGVRFSQSRETTRDDMLEAARSYAQVIARLRGEMPGERAT